MQEEILHELLNLGEAMLTNGAEINRVEDTLNRMGKAYGGYLADRRIIWKQ